MEKTLSVFPQVFRDEFEALKETNLDGVKATMYIESLHSHIYFKLNLLFNFVLVALLLSRPLALALRKGQSGSR